MTGAAVNIRRAVEAHAFEHEGLTLQPTLSLGVAAYPEAGPTTEDLTRASDDALHRAKHSGGNTFSE